MANIAVQRIKREFKEVLKSEEVRLIYKLLVSPKISIFCFSSTLYFILFAVTVKLRRQSTFTWGCPGVSAGRAPITLASFSFVFSRDSRVRWVCSGNTGDFVCYVTGLLLKYINKILSQVNLFTYKSRVLCALSYPPWVVFVSLQVS